MYPINDPKGARDDDRRRVAPPAAAPLPAELPCSVFAPSIVRGSRPESFPGGAVPGAKTASSLMSFLTPSSSSVDGVASAQRDFHQFSYPEQSNDQKAYNGDYGSTGPFTEINQEWWSGQTSFPMNYSFSDNNPNYMIKQDTIRSSLLSGSYGLIQEATSPQEPSSLYPDIGAKSSSKAIEFPSQRGCFHTEATNLASLYNVDSHQRVQATGGTEAHNLTAPTSGSGTLLPARKRKIVYQSSEWNSNVTQEIHPLRNTFQAPSSRRKNICGQSNTKSSGCSTHLPKSSPEIDAGNHHAVYPYPYSNVEELREREWTKLLEKELTSTDVGNLGRIVLPKKDAEANLPPLIKKDGLLLEMVDITYHMVWGFKYRFWPNNKSRMYILENTGNFARMNKLESGDSFVIYGDRASGCFLVRVIKKPTHEGAVVGTGTTHKLPMDNSRLEWLSSDQSHGLRQLDATQGPKSPLISFLMGFPLNHVSGSSASHPGQID